MFRSYCTTLRKTILVLALDNDLFLYTIVYKRWEAPCSARNSPIVNGDAAPVWHRSFTRLVFSAAPSPCETCTAANPVVTALGESSMHASTWFDDKGESCASCLCLGNGKGAFGKRLRTTKRWSS